MREPTIGRGSRLASLNHSRRKLAVLSHPLNREAQGYASARQLVEI